MNRAGMISAILQPSSTEHGATPMSTTTATLEQGQAAAHTMEQAQTAIRANVDKAIKTAGDMFTFAQGNFEAFTHSSQILATGWQDMSQTLAASAKATVDDTMHTFKAISSAKSIKEAMDLQATLLRSTLEKAVSHGGKITDTSIKLSEQALAPITARLTLAAETFGRVS
jgi:phasin family protein